MSSPTPALLYRIDPKANMARFYALSIEPCLFGGSTLVRSWGRIGTRGRCRVALYEDDAQAGSAWRRLVERKLSRGYVPAGAARAAQGIVTPQGAKTASAGFVEPPLAAE